MKYEVIQSFNDAQDREYSYHEGDIYPRDGIAPSEQRIKDLMNGNNIYRLALIRPYTGNNKVETLKEVVQEVPEEEIHEELPKEEPAKEVVWTSEEIDKMPFMKLKSIAKKNGVDVTDKKADEIRTELKEKLGI